MKKEMLRINDLNMESSAVEKLINISICLLGGECVGFFGLEDSGKNLLVDFICGQHELGGSGYYIDGIRHIHTEDLKKHVYKITVLNYLIDDWTVAEYIYLVDDNSFIMDHKKLVAKAEELLNGFGLDISGERKLKNLTELEKRSVDILKAYSKKAKIIVIEDEFEGCSTQDIEQFKILLDQVIRRKISAIVNSHSHNVSYILSDKYIIFKKGYIIKKCDKKFIHSSGQMDTLLLGTPGVSSQQDVRNSDGNKRRSDKIVLSVSNMALKDHEPLHFNFYQSEVVALIALDVKLKTYIFELLSGRYVDKNMSIEMEGNPCKFNDIIDFVKNKIASIADMGGESELLGGMSAGNNLFIPSLKKISAMQHMLMERRVVKMLENQFNCGVSIKRENVKNMSVNDHISLLLERWYIYKPKVLVLFEPFVHCDPYGVSLIKSYIQKFTAIGSTVIIIKSREEYVEEISGRIIHI